MKTVHAAYEELGFTRDTFYSSLLEGCAPSGFSGVAFFCVDDVFGKGTRRNRVIYDRTKVVAAIKRLGRDGPEVNELADALTYCDGSCLGCMVNDGSGCDAIALFASHGRITDDGDETTGLPCPNCGVKQKRIEIEHDGRHLLVRVNARITGNVKRGIDGLVRLLRQFTE